MWIKWNNSYTQISQSCLKLPSPQQQHFVLKQNRPALSPIPGLLKAGASQWRTQVHGALTSMGSCFLKEIRDFSHTNPRPERQNWGKESGAESQITSPATLVKITLIFGIIIQHGHRMCCVVWGGEGLLDAASRCAVHTWLSIWTLSFVWACSL